MTSRAEMKRVWAKQALTRYRESAGLQAGYEPADFVALLVGCSRVEAQALMEEVDAEREEGRPTPRRRQG